MRDSPCVQEIHHALFEAQSSDEQDDWPIDRPADVDANPLALGRCGRVEPFQVHAVRQIVNALARHAGPQRLPLEIAADADNVIRATVDGADRRLERAHGARFGREP
ncbi:MAG: hypothetical protein DMG03_07445 [Acidobacteria bacterium]|nr:MAG: hypothetical protein DMG03_07445 [Acidobacteriota bacterium]